MAAYDELTSEAEIAADENTSVEARGFEDLAPESVAPSLAAAESEYEPLLAASPSAAKKGFGVVALKRLIAMLTGQYVIVTAMAALAAVTVASEAAKIINAKLDLIIAALKRF